MTEIDRRHLVAGAAALGAALPSAWPGEAPAQGGWTPSQRVPDPAVEVLDPSFAKYRLSLATIERVATGLRWAEGPAWFGDWDTLLFSDVTNDRILALDAGSGRLTVFRQPSDYANGNTRDRRGRLLTCRHRSRSVVRTELDGSLTPLAEGFEGRPLNSPNDIVCRSDGAVWFTDPDFGPNPYEQMAAPELPGRVYRIDPATGGITVAAQDVRGPNGLCFSPDETRLYVVESKAQPNRCIRVYDVAADGRTLANGRLFFDAGAGTPDGLRADVDGNLWCGWGMGEAEDGVVVLSPEGRMIGRIRLPERCANLAFGGRERNRLMMCATHSVYSLYVNTRGAGIC